MSRRALIDHLRDRRAAHPQIAAYVEATMTPPTLVGSQRANWRAEDLDEPGLQELLDRINALVP